MCAVRFATQPRLKVAADMHKVKLPHKSNFEFESLKSHDCLPERSAQQSHIVTKIHAESKLRGGISRSHIWLPLTFIDPFST